MTATRHLLGLVLVLGVLVGHHLAVELSPSCGFDNSPKSSSNEPRIIGGQRAKSGEFPHQVLLTIMRDQREPYHCGGIIVDHSFILTAAHCVEKRRPQDLTAHVGSTFLYGGKAYSVVKIRVHENFIDARNPRIILNDLALLKTATPIKFELPSSGHGSVNRVCMPKGPVNYREGDEFIVSGWGRTREEVEEHPNELQKLKVPYLDGKQCSAMYQKLLGDEYILIDPKGQICTGGRKNEGTCYGDSGGPLVRLVDGAYELVGVVSGGSRCANKTVPGFFARVDHFLQWIEENKKKMSL